MKAMRKSCGRHARENLESRKREMEGWELGDRPDLLPDNGDDEMDNDMGPVDHGDFE